MSVSPGNEVAETVTSGGSVTPARDHAREVVARTLAQMGPHEDWPTNEALGGGLTGTRDDEFRAAMHEQADAAIDAVLGLLPEDRVSELWRGDPKHDGYNARIDGWNAALAAVRERLGAS